MPQADWMHDWTVRVRLWVERDGHAVLGEGRAELLSAINEHHSITKAAKAARMSYRRAWTIVQDVNSAAGEPLVESSAGGSGGGGARLTPRGLLALEVYDEVRQKLVESAAGALQRSVHSDAAAAASVHVAAAISLQEALGQILAEFALQRPTVHVRTIFGASNELADHLLAGAPGDLLISAEPAELDRLAASGMLVAGSRRMVARNGLAGIGRPGLEKVRRAADFLADKVKRVALAEPAAPLGRYSKSYLQSAGVYDRLLPKALHVDNSRAVMAAVVSKVADAGLVFSSDAARSGDWQILFRVPPAKAAATYEAALIAGGQNQSAANLLLDFLSTRTAARCLRRNGLQPLRE